MKILLAIALACCAAAASAQPVQDKLIPASAVNMQGYLGKRLDQSYSNRVFKQDVDELIEPFRHRTETRMWQSEFWGKWFTSAVLAYRYRPEPASMKVLQAAVSGIISTQSSDGYIGNYSPDHHLEQWDVWGRKYVMLGLLDYHALTGDKASLAAAVKVADHLMAELKLKGGLIVNKGNYRGMAASSVLEPVIRLYNVTKAGKYLEFAKDIVRQWETPAGPNLISKAGIDVSKRFPKPKSWYSPEQGQKAYEMMSCYEGLLELYRITGDNSYKEAVEKTWANIRDTEINVTGSGASEEMWFGGNKLQVAPVAHFQETCVTVTWIKLNQQLLRLTGEAKYAHQIEKSYYNSLLASLSNDGSEWAKYTPLNGERLPGSGQCGMSLNCCDASGPRGQFTLPLTTVMSSGDGISINFYAEGQYELKSPAGKKVTVIQTTSYPVSGLVKLRLNMADEEMSIRLRIPAWSKLTRVTVNGQEQSGIQAGEYLTLKRNWSAKDVIAVEFDMRGRLVNRGESQKYSAIERGPIVLARDSRLTGPSLVTVISPVVDKGGFVELKASTGENWMQFTAMFRPESYTEAGAAPISIGLCDYASAGNGKTKSVFAVWLPQLYSGRANE